LICLRLGYHASSRESLSLTFNCSRHRRYLHSFPTRRSSDLDLMTLYNSEKQPAYEVMKGFGFDADSIGEDLLQKDEVKAMMELHIEQGGVLEEESKSVGIVHAIAGMNTFQVTLNGVSNHARSEEHT